MKWLQPGPSPHQTALAMIGAKAGQRVLFIGAGNGQLPAEVARVTGLNGRTLAIDRDAHVQKAVESAAANAGTLVEFEPTDSSTLTADTGTFDIVVVHQKLSVQNAEAAHTVGEAVRLVREGGRVVVIEGAPPAGLLAKLRRPQDTGLPAGSIRDLLANAGLRAARVLAETDGVKYVEGTKPRTP